MPVGKAEIAITLDFRRLCCAARAREQRIEFDATARLGQREMSNRFDREVVKTAVIGALCGNRCRSNSLQSR
jgi:hypothetical protein